jgi:hypothetical protein
VKKGLGLDVEIRARSHIRNHVVTLLLNDLIHRPQGQGRCDLQKTVAVQSVEIEGGP